VQATFFNQSLAMENNEDILLHVDFAENYLCESQDETQAAHWLQSQITVFTACFWTPSRHNSFVIISDDIHHEKTSVALFLDMLLQNYLPQLSSPKRLTIFSDGAASQFKNRYILAILP
jgi:hypothetical protein